ncbi:hypothetical protein Tdes44962_MAKER03021 [Teratosphaeria destructans]|uniref:Uncharacterized protein n=1 Tax=Teratosphaeria destructans TaxID=418781 RepID=A0A9W7W220_9PEZI|nr:hypothetical protein Tdes44962_MAKER03021 [Teratosphaeria destructans]
MSVLEPYPSRMALVPDMRRCFGPDCAEGRVAVQDLVENGLLGTFTHITSTVRRDPSRTKTLRLLREHNARVLAHLPGTVWYITCVEMDLPAATRAASLAPGPESGMPVKDLRVRGTFDDSGRAIEAARGVAQALVREDQGGRALREIPGQQVAGTTWAAVVRGRGVGASEMRLVTVKEEAGGLVDH